MPLTLDRSRVNGCTKLLSWVTELTNIMSECMHGIGNEIGDDAVRRARKSGSVHWA